MRLGRAVAWLRELLDLILTNWGLEPLCGADAYMLLTEGSEFTGELRPGIALIRTPKEWPPKIDRAVLEGMQTAATWITEVVGVSATPTGAQSASLAQKEMTLAQAAREFDVPTWALSRAASKPRNKPGHLPTRRVGNNVNVTREDVKAFADNYDARRERRVVGSKNPEGRNIVAALKEIKKTSKRSTERNSK